MVLNDVARKARRGYALPAKGAILTDSRAPTSVAASPTDGRPRGRTRHWCKLFKRSFATALFTGTSPGSPAMPGCLGTRPLTAPPLGALGRAAQGAGSRT